MRVLQAANHPHPVGISGGEGFGELYDALWCVPRPIFAEYTRFRTPTLICTYPFDAPAMISSCLRTCSGDRRCLDAFFVALSETCNGGVRRWYVSILFWSCSWFRRSCAERACRKKHPEPGREGRGFHTSQLVVSSQSPDPSEHAQLEGPPLESRAGRAGRPPDLEASGGIPDEGCCEGVVGIV